MAKAAPRKIDVMPALQRIISLSMASSAFNRL
jgi:hypothetical protein